MTAAFDVLVVGAGPGGIAAATIAAEAGKRVCLIDDNPTPGGQIWRGYRADSAARSPHGKAYLTWLARMRTAAVEIWSGWAVVDAPQPGTLRLERDGACRDVVYGNLVLATGARERFLPFPGWTLPGVAGVGGLQALAKAGLDLRGKRVVVAGTGPLLHAVAAGLAKSGAQIRAVFEQASPALLARFGLSTLLAHPAKIAEGLRYRRQAGGSLFSMNSWVIRAEGDGRVLSVTVTDGAHQRTLECDWLACAYHLVPNLELPRLLGCRVADGYVAVDARQQSSTANVFCVGELTGIGGLDKAIVEGQIAGLASAGRDQAARSLAPQQRRWQRFAARMDRAFALRPELRALPRPETLVCRCEDVSHQALEGSASWREAKLHTRCGMGACQGRICGAAAEFLYGWKHSSMRPPIYPASVSTLAAEIEPVSTSSQAR